MVVADRLDEAVKVLAELVGEPCLSAPRGADDRDEPRAPLAASRMEEVFELAQLVVAAHERGLQCLGWPAAAPPCDDTEGAPGRHGGHLAVESLLAGRLESDRSASGSLRGLSDENSPRGSYGLQSGGGVDEVADSRTLVRRVERNGSLAGHDPCSCGDARPKPADRIDKLERRANRPLGVVFAGRRSAPHCRDRVTDALLDRAAIASDHLAGEVDVLGQQFPGVLRFATLRERR